MNWFKHLEDVAHLCGGTTNKEKNNKPKGTQTDKTLWFQPTEVLPTGSYKCKACGEETDTQTTITEIN